ncbi:Translation termination inhibitor protein ITT1 [Wickerhamomyces ciferrii]|uniref:RBR-type E3 ubiquitin transferase n=1 Tax=Wickerhamomyces ciferrii (strain ATCC 14091 / BCRC 22168 / CBS 111 / JCM 3599 / NBRC 0793 / NRRL Y-1031 F-60-10) TaxID=1206466 RepID=K0KIC6_WICCF|nr:Translation termination inhibitor protein ITT1 [Wickerhamomyces ciferrii]CCH41149.1 Translation termination inhibitor protein ITT1 [Wickerhamomyces ciferrii]
MTDEEDGLPDDLEVLKSIYPEAEISSSSISLNIKLIPSTKNRILLISSGQVLKTFETRWFDPLHFKIDLPLNNGVIYLESKWLNEDVLQMMKMKLEGIRTDAIKDDMLDSLSYTLINYLTVDLIEDFDGDIFPSKTEDPEYYQLLETLSHQVRFTTFQNERFDCSICIESHDGTNGILLDCDHAFCKSCFKQYSEPIMNSKYASTLQCPNCPIMNLKNLDSKGPAELRELLFERRMKKEDLLQMYTPEVVEKFENDRDLVLFEKYQNYFPFVCAKCPRCKKWGFRDDLDDNLVICKNCKLAYCYQCNHSWHGNNNLCRSRLNQIPEDVIQNMLSGELDSDSKVKFIQQYGKRTLNLAIKEYLADIAFEKAIEDDENLVKCPRCSTVVTKSDGCHKMKCPLCSANFCYRCSSHLDDDNPYTHYADPLSPCYKLLFEGMPGAQ